jgi:hypothetical protein
MNLLLQQAFHFSSELEMISDFVDRTVYSLKLSSLILYQFRLLDFLFLFNNFHYYFILLRLLVLIYLPLTRIYLIMLLVNVTFLINYLNDNFI